MNIVFEDLSLEELYLNGKTSSHKYKRLSIDIIRRYIKTVNYLRSADRIEALYQINSLHYEKKSGDLNGVETVWINDQYRLLFHSSPNEEGIIVNALLSKISKHYE